ncbi:unnamed protein product [Sphagnum compactum]
MMIFRVLCKRARLQQLSVRNSSRSRCSGGVRMGDAPLLRLVLARRPREELEGSDVSARCGGRKRVPVKEELVCRTLGITMGVAKEIKKDDSVAPTDQAPNPGAPLDRSLPCATAPEIRSLPKSSPCSSTSWTTAGRWEHSGEREITGRPKGARPDTHTKQQTI